MATEDAKPESTLILEQESEGKGHSDASGLQVDKFPPEEKMHGESFPEKSQGSVEYLMNDIIGSNESRSDKENPKDESKNLQNQVNEFKGDSQLTSFLDKEECLMVSNAPAVTKIDPEIVHSGADVLDQTKTKTIDFAEMVSLKGDSIPPDPAVLEKHNEAEEGKSGHSEKELLSSSLVAESKNETPLKYMESDNLEDNSGNLTENSQSSTKSTPEMKETSCLNEVPSMDNIESSIGDKQSSSGENHESCREASDAGCVDIRQNHTMVGNQNKALEEGEANNSENEFEKAEESPELRSNQSTVEPEDNHTKRFLVQKAPAVMKSTDYSHASLPLELESTGEETPSVISNQEQGPVKCVEEDLNDATSYAHGTTVEDTIQEDREAPLEEILEAGRSDDQNNVKEEVDEDKPNHTLKNSIDETCMDFSMVYSQNNRDEFIDQETEDSNLPPEEVNRDISLSNFRVEAKEDGSLQEFQSVAHTNEAAEEANHSELLDVKDCCIVTSDETSKAVLPETVKDAREQKEAPTPAAPEEIKESKEDLAYTANVVPQVSEENSFDQKANDSLDRDASQWGVGKEASVDKATTDGMPLDAITNLEEKDTIDATQKCENQISSEDHIDEEPCQVLTAEKNINHTSAEEVKVEGYVSNSTKEDDLRSETCTGETKDAKKSETTCTESQNAKMTDANQSVKTQVTSEESIIEPRQVLTSEELGDYSSPEEEDRNINDTTAMAELNQKFLELETIDDTEGSKRETQGGKNVAGELPQLSSREEIENHAVERKEEWTVNDAIVLDNEFQPEGMVNEASADTDNFNENIKANHSELLDVKDCCIVTSDETSKAVVPQTVKDVSEQKEVPTPTAPEEIKESKEELAYTTNVEPQVSEENSFDQEAIEKANDSLDRDASQWGAGKEEASVDRATTDGMPLDTLNISPHEEPQKTIESEEADYEQSIPGFTSKDQTTKQEQGDKEGIIDIDESGAVEEANKVAENEIQNHIKVVLIDSVVQAVEYHDVDRPPEDSSIGLDSTGEETPSVISNQEQGLVKCVEENLNNATSYAHGTTVEDTTQEDREIPLEEILEAVRSDDQNNVRGVVEEDKPNHDLKNTIDETCMDFGMVYSQNNTEECIDQETETNNLPPEEVNQDISLSNFRVEAKEDGSFHEFQCVVHTIEEVEEANQSELLDVKDCCIVTSDETSKAVVPPTVRDAREQKEVPTPTAPEEIKDSKEELARTTNVVPQVSEENRFEQEAIEKANDSPDRDASQWGLGKEEASVDKATTDGMPLDTSNIFPHEEPQKTIKSEETDYEQSIPGLASEDQTTKHEQGDKESIIEIAENSAVEEANSVAENEIQDHSKVLLGDLGVQTVEYHAADQPSEESSKSVCSFDPDCRSTEAALVTNAAQVSSAAGLVDFLEEMPSVELPNQEPTLTSTEGKIDNTNTDGNIVYEATDDTFETSTEQELIHNEGNEPAELDISCTLTKEINGECHGTESEPKEYLSAADDPLERKSEKIQEPSIEEKTEDAEIADNEHLTLYQSLGSQSKMTDEQYKQATEPLSIGDKNCKSQQDIPSSQEFGEKPEPYTEKHTTGKKDAEDKSSAEDFRCGVPEHEVSLQAYEKDELMQEADWSETATRVSEETKHPSNITKLEEQETVDATQTYQDQMPSDQKVFEGSGHVLIEDEVADYSHLDERQDKGLHQEIDQEVDPLIQMLSEVRVIEDLEVPSEISTEKETRSYSTAEENESTDAGDSKEFEEPEIAHIIQSFPEQLSNKENDIEKPHQVSIAKLVVHSSLAEEEKEEENANETNKKDEIKLEVESRSTVHYVSETGHCPSYSSKSEDEIFKGDIQMAREISKDGLAEPKEDESNHKDMTYLDQLKPEIPDAAEEIETTEGNQRLNTEMEFQDKDVETPALVSFAEEAVKCNSVEEGNTPDDVLVPLVDPEPKVDDTSEVMGSVSQNTKLEDTEEVNEEPSQVSTAQKTIDCTPAEEGMVDDHVRNSTKDGDLKFEEYPGVIQNEIPETISSERQIVKMTDAKEMTNERKSIITKEPHTVSSSEEIDFFTFQEKEEKTAHDIMATDELNTKVDPEVRANEIPEPSPMGAKVVLEGDPQVLNPEEMMNYNCVVERKEGMDFSNTSTEELNSKLTVNEILKAETDFNESTKPVETDMTDAIQSFKNQIPNKDQFHEEPSPGVTAEETVNQTPEEEQKEKKCITNLTKEGNLNSEVYTGVAKDEIFETTNSEIQSTEIADAKLSLNIQMTTEEKGVITECPQQFSTSEEIGYSGLPREEKSNINDTTARDELNEKEDPETQINEVPRTTHCGSESKKVEESPIIDTTQSCKELKQGEDMVGAGHSQLSHTEEIMKYNFSAERKEEWNVNTTAVPAEVKPDVMVSEISEPIINLSESAKTASEGSIVEVPSPSTIEIINEALSIKGNDESIAQVTRSKVESKIEENSNIEGNETSDTPGAESAITSLEGKDTIDATQKCENQISSEDQIDEEEVEKNINHVSAEEVEVEGYVSNSTKEDDLRSETYTGETKDAKKSETTCTESQSAKMTDANQSVKTQVTSEETIEEPQQVSTSEELGDYSPPEEEDRKINDTTATDELNQKVLEPETIDDTEGSKWETQGGKNVAGELPQLSSTEEIENHAVERNEEWTANHATILDNEFQPEGMVNEVSADTNNFNENIKLEEGKTTETIWSSNIQMAQEEKIVEVPLQDSTSNEISSHGLSDKELDGGACKNSTIDELKIEGNLNVQQMDDTAETLSMESEATKLEEHELIDVTQSVGENEMPSEDSGLESPCKSPMVEEVIIYNPEDETKEESIVKVAEINAKSKSEEMELNSKDMPQTMTNTCENTKFDGTEIIHTTQTFKKKCPSDDKIPEGPNPVSGEQEVAISSPALEEKEEAIIKVRMTTLEQTDDFASTQTETIARTSNTKNSSSEVESEPSFINTEGPSPDGEDREAATKVYDSKMEIEEKDDSVLLTDASISMDIHMPYESSIAESNLEIIANQSPKTDTITKIESRGEEVAKRQKYSADEILQVEIEELEHEDTSKGASNTVSTIPRESGWNSDEKEQIVKEPLKFSPPTSIIMLHDDEEEDTMIHYQSQCHSSLIMENHPATEIQNEPYLSHEMPDEAMFPDSEGRGAPNQIDSSNMKIEQKDDLVALEAPPAIHASFKSSILVSDVDNLVTKDPKMGVDAKITSQEEEMTIMHRADETLQPEIEGLDPEGEVVTKAVSIIMQDSSSKDDKIEEKLQEQGNMSKQTQVPKLNEEVKDLDQDEYQSILAIKHDSTREAQSEPLLQDKKPTEGMLVDSREETEQNNSLIHVAESGENHLPFKISNAGTDTETIEKENPKTGIDTKIECQDKERSTPEKSQAGETVHTDVKKLEPKSTSNAVAQAVGSSPLQSSRKDDKEGANAKEQVKHSDQKNVLNEGTEEYIIDHSSASKVQNEQSLNSRPTDEMLTDGKVLVHAGELLPEIQHGESKEETTKSTSEEESMTSLQDLLQTSTYGNIKVIGDPKIENEPIIPGNEVKEGDKPNGDEDRDEEDTEREAATDSPVIVEASRDADVKITPKKSNNILSGVGSKVKHSIAKVKKVITGKSSSPKSSSPT